MKYPIPAVLFGSLIGISFAVAGFALAQHLTTLPAAPPIQPRVVDQPDVAPAPIVPQPVVEVNPYTLEEIAKLQDRSPLGADEIGRLVACFSAKDLDLCMQAELLLKEVGANAIAPVRAALKHDKAQARLAAAETLGWIGPPAAIAAPDLMTLLGDENAGVRRKAAFALGRLGMKSDMLITALIGVVNDPEEDVAETALDALEAIGPVAAPKMYAFAAVSKGAPRKHVLATLVKFGSPPKEALPILIDMTQLTEIEENNGVRHQAIVLLGHLGEDALPTFKQLLKKSKNEDYAAIVTGMQNLGPKAKALLPEFTVVVEAEARRSSVHADEAMLSVFKACGPDGAKSMATILRNLEGEGVVYSIRITMLKGISQMGDDARPVLPFLIDMLNKNDGKRLYVTQRGHILEALGDIGPIAKEAIPAVRNLTSDSMYGELARTTLRRLGVIEPKSVPE
jgi:HEAT repeat protein